MGRFRQKVFIFAHFHKEAGLYLANAACPTNKNGVYFAVLKRQVWRKIFFEKCDFLRTFHFWSLVCVFHQFHLFRPCVTICLTKVLFEIFIYLKIPLLYQISANSNSYLAAGCWLFACKYSLVRRYLQELWFISFNFGTPLKRCLQIKFHFTTSVMFLWSGPLPKFSTYFIIRTGATDFD